MSDSTNNSGQKSGTKKPINTLVKESGKKSLAKLADSVLYAPSPSQQKAKARFFNRFESSPFLSLDSITAVQAMEITGIRSIKDWWSKPGFKDWFLNRNEAGEKLEYLFSLALDTAEQILRDPEAQTNAKVQMIKIAAELADKMPSKHKEKFADKEIGEMNPERLNEFLDKAVVDYIKRKGLKLVEETTINVSPGEKEDGGNVQQ